MDGTDSQVEIVRYALDHRDETVGEVARELGWSPQWVEQVLLRADDEFYENHVRSERESNDTLSVSVKSAISGPDGLESLIWETPDGEYVELACSEWCADCGEYRDVRYLVPVETVRYAERPECGHDPMLQVGGSDWQADLQALRQSVSNVLNKVTNGESGRETWNGPRQG